MLRYVASRLLDLVLVAWIVATVVFFLLRVIPGDPVLILAGIDAVSEDAVARLRAEMGLDRPVAVQYATWLAGLLQGDMGASLRRDVPVTALVFGAAPATLQIAVLAAAIGIGASVPLGVAAARAQGRARDGAITAAALLGISTPHFVIALLFIYVFALGLGLLPTSGYVPFAEDPVEALRHLILPALTLGLVMAGILVRMMRRSMIDELGEDYVRTARAKGASEGRTLYGHALRNALIPFVTIAGIEVGILLSGAVIIETVFAIPGLGRLMIETINQRDYTVVQGAVLLSAVFYVLVNFAVDLLYTALDPRVRVGAPAR